MQEEVWEVKSAPPPKKRAAEEEEGALHRGLPRTLPTLRVNWTRRSWGSSRPPKGRRGRAPNLCPCLAHPEDRGQFLGISVQFDLCHKELDFCSLKETSHLT